MPSLAAVTPPCNPPTDSLPCLSDTEDSLSDVSEHAPMGDDEADADGFDPLGTVLLITRVVYSTCKLKSLLVTFSLASGGTYFICRQHCHSLPLRALLLPYNSHACTYRALLSTTAATAGKQGAPNFSYTLKSKHHF